MKHGDAQGMEGITRSMCKIYRYSNIFRFIGTLDAISNTITYYSAYLVHTTGGACISPVLVYDVENSLAELIDAPGHLHLRPVHPRRPTASDGDLGFSKITIATTAEGFEQPPRDVTS